MKVSFCCSAAIHVQHNVIYCTACDESLSRSEVVNREVTELDLLNAALGRSMCGRELGQC